MNISDPGLLNRSEGAHCLETVLSSEPPHPVSEETPHCPSPCFTLTPSAQPAGYKGRAHTVSAVCHWAQGRADRKVGRGWGGQGKWWRQEERRREK